MKTAVNTITTTILPVNGFTGNASINIFINGTSYDRDFNPIPCLYQLRVYIPRCSVSPSPLLKQLEKKTVLTEIVFSPNPVTDLGILTWSGENNIDLFQLFDFRGQLINEIKIPIQVNEINISMESLPQGIYLLKLWSKDFNIRNLKVIKK
ncbi:T9SS type A sorting domain-containing protein [Flavobacterium sp.]|uniref:T9SS type A sorting domain-containing protein n=1 Tax=Flavobacterium sp. TaxID=239 RepID=UPI0039E41614